MLQLYNIIYYNVTVTGKVQIKEIIWAIIMLIGRSGTHCWHMRELIPGRWEAVFEYGGTCFYIIVFSGERRNENDQYVGGPSPVILIFL